MSITGNSLAVYAKVNRGSILTACSSIFFSALGVSVHSIYKGHKLCVVCALCVVNVVVKGVGVINASVSAVINSYRRSEVLSENRELKVAKPDGLTVFIIDNSAVIIVIGEVVIKLVNVNSCRSTFTVLGITKGNIALCVSVKHKEELYLILR